MKKELTREVIGAMSMCSHNVGCKKCAALYFCNGKMWPERCKWLASALLEEVDKPKDDVWSGASLQSVRAAVNYYENGKLWGTREFTRELPKTRARQIAEEIGCPFNVCPFYDEKFTGNCVGEIRGGTLQEKCRWYKNHVSALEKYAAELGTEK